jgi:hypothetical protein
MDLKTMIVLILIPLLIVFASQIILKITYKKYKLQEIDNNLTGKDVAEKILKEYDLDNIRIKEISGELSDNYNNSKKRVSLSTDIYETSSIASVAVAAHECGHAIQYKEGYIPIKIRNALVPFVNIGSSLGYYVIIISLVVTALDDFFYLGLIMVSFALIFQLITLPVEFDASKRANKILVEMGLISKEEQRGTKIMLKAAAFTYVAGLISALASTTYHVLRIILIYGGRNKD